MHFWNHPWPWYIAGPLLGLTVPLLLLIGNKPFGASAIFRHLCAIVIQKKEWKYFKYDWSKESWNFYFIGGIVLGGAIAATLIPNLGELKLHPYLVDLYHGLGINDFSQGVPKQIFNMEGLRNVEGIVFVLAGGFMVGFGSRYAGGDNSGHMILGVARLNKPSIITTACFFVGGYIGAHYIVPFILKVV
ncbi:MAG: YeeE/YedE thiosulfate transporter family protein [Bacteroidota bacterium]